MDLTSTVKLKVVGLLFVMVLTREATGSSNMLRDETAMARNRRQAECETKGYSRLENANVTTGPFTYVDNNLDAVLNTGYVTKIVFFASHTGSFRFIVLQPDPSPPIYRIKHNIEITVTQTGLQEYLFSRPLQSDFNMRWGLSVDSGQNSPVPHHFEPSAYGLRYQGVFLTASSGVFQSASTFSSLRFSLNFAICSQLTPTVSPPVSGVTPPLPEAASVLGPDPLARPHHDVNNARFQYIILDASFKETSYAVQWRAHTALSGVEVRLQLWRPVGSDDRYLLIHSTTHITKSVGYFQLDINPPVLLEANDVIGFTNPADVGAISYSRNENILARLSTEPVPAKNGDVRQFPLPTDRQFSLQLIYYPTSFTTPAPTTTPPTSQTTATTSRTTSSTTPLSPVNLVRFGNPTQQYDPEGPSIVGPYTYSDNSAGRPLPDGVVHRIEFYATTGGVRVDFLLLESISAPTNFLIRNFATATTVLGQNSLPVYWQSGNNDRMGFYVAPGAVVPLSQLEENAYYSAQASGPLQVVTGQAVTFPRLAGKRFAFSFFVDVGAVAAPTTSGLPQTSSIPASTVVTSLTSTAVLSPPGCPAQCPSGPPGPLSLSRKKRSSKHVSNEEKKAVETLKNRLASLVKWLVVLTSYCLLLPVISAFFFFCFRREKLGFLHAIKPKVKHAQTECYKQ